MASRACQAAPLAPGRPASGQAAGRAGPLWLAVYLPWLAGEILTSDPRRPRVVSEPSSRGWLVYRASPEARARGIQPGMTVSAAGVLCAGLVSQQRRRQDEQRRLEAIGDWMLAFSPVVSIQGPETVLLEIRGSLNLFGGVERLRQGIGERLEAAGHVYRIAGAATPLAACCLAHWGREAVIEDKAALGSALGAMPVALLGLETKTIRRLERAGIGSLRDLWRLPDDGLAGRFGTALVRKLDQLRGRQPDPRPRHQAAPRFAATLTLDWATADLASITRGLEYLIRQWAADLRRAARGTTGFTVQCRSGKGKREIRLEVGVRHVSRDPDHLCRLAAEKLSRTRLEEPVMELALSSRHIHPLAGHNEQLFETAQTAAMAWRQNEELLAMQLGGAGLETLYPVAEHRPGLAWSKTAGCGAPTPCGAAPRRPLWLLDPPRPWPGPGEPSRGGAGAGLVKGPERIETGWWDQRDQRRDYYVAADHRGRRLWVFRDLKQGRWYLHGLFA